MVGIAAAAAGIAMLRSASGLGSQVVFAAVWGAIGVALLGVIYRRGPQRAWWVGFVLFSSGAFVLETIPWPNGKLADRSLSDSVLLEIHRWLTPIRDSSTQRTMTEYSNELAKIDSYPVRSGINKDQRDLVQGARDWVGSLGPKDRAIVVSHLNLVDDAAERAELKTAIYLTPLPASSGRPPWGQPEDFVAIGVSLGNLLIGCLGGVTAWLMYTATNEAAAASAAPRRDVAERDDRSP
jgi:hypothetical protein